MSPYREEKASKDSNDLNFFLFPQEIQE